MRVGESKIILLKRKFKITSAKMQAYFYDIYALEDIKKNPQINLRILLSSFYIS